MRLSLLVIFSIVLSALGCSHTKETVRVPASVMKDVGVIGPDGRVLLYYQEGKNIIVKSCDPYTILGLTPAEARQNCTGKKNEVSVGTFKQAIRSMVSADRLDTLKPLTPEEIKTFNEAGPSSKEIEDMVVELDKINAFIKNYGPGDANLVRKDEIIKAIAFPETKAAIIKKINGEIEKTISLIVDQTQVTLTKFSNDKDKFLYTVLSNFDPTKSYPCGLVGSVEERIKDCSDQESSTVGEFRLVTKTKEFKEVHLHEKTGLLWSDTLPGKMRYVAAYPKCKSSQPEMGNIKGAAWGMPTLDHYKDAARGGMRLALPNIVNSVWTATVAGYGGGEPLNYIYNIDADAFSSAFLNSEFDNYSVRCVSSAPSKEKSEDVVRGGVHDSSR